MDLVQLVILIFPAYVANALPVLLGGGPPLDLGKKFIDGRPIFGPGKTIRGSAVALISGVSVAIVAAFVVPDLFIPWLDFPSKIMAGFLLAVGTMAGDLLGSFVKRRLGIPRGGRFVADQLLFLLVALAFALPFFIPSFTDFLFLLVLTYVLHVGLNRAANALGLKRVPW